MVIRSTENSAFIKLDQFLKWQNIVQTGGEAKVLIQNGQVDVNGQMELRRGRKLYCGDVVAVGDRTYVVEHLEQNRG